MSMAGAVCYGPNRNDAAIVFQTRPGAYSDEMLICFITELHDFLDGAKLTLLWDGLPSHKSKKMRQFLASQRRWLVVERLPAYAPELNPVEGMWGNLKGTELANRCAETIDEVQDVAHRGMRRIGSDPELAYAFLRQCGLSI
jgi:DDE superfamily endonuclease